MFAFENLNHEHKVVSFNNLSLKKTVFNSKLTISKLLIK
jgi:hypothetical protein